ncbi:hypothetical protein L5G32_11680 [Gordonia sp. HY002]|uniref:hypothetical protein n=1 Tax=Gordonia zhenghanii TaxID=2911516 RepID=UPI001EEFEFEC|nr:hypothetical protein [Gordonia zhenghanii]MCF8570926.1 hypothetical protein [Gordonia zhenghanii]MCF8606997.1 hypothetical protein [Gordonia zhenghanii]
MRISTRLAVAAVAVAAVLAPSVAVASASSSEPTAGDTVRYTFYSDVQNNESTNWFDGDNDMDSFETTRLSGYSRSTTKWFGSKSVVSRSTYQLTGSSFQTSGYYAGCAIYVNGTLVSSDSATGRYAVAVC